MGLRSRSATRRGDGAPGAPCAVGGPEPGGAKGFRGEDLFTHWPAKRRLRTRSGTDSGRPCPRGQEVARPWLPRHPLARSLLPRAAACVAALALACARVDASLQGTQIFGSGSAAWREKNRRACQPLLLASSSRSLAPPPRLAWAPPPHRAGARVAADGVSDRQCSSATLARK